METARCPPRASQLTAAPIPWLALLSLALALGLAGAWGSATVTRAYTHQQPWAQVTVGAPTALASDASPGRHRDNQPHRLQFAARNDALPQTPIHQAGGWRTAASGLLVAPLGFGIGMAVALAVRTRRPRRTLAPLLSNSVDAAAEPDPAAALRGAVAGGWVVQCRVYNLDRYGFIPVANKLLQKEVDGVWHVAIAAYGCEYWFDHQIEKQDLSTVQFARGFAPSFVYDLGTTTMPQADFEKWLKDVMDLEYNIQKYDCFQHNCHHFANDAAVYLTGKRIPQWCIDHGEDGLSAVVQSGADEKLTRSVANKIARIMMVSWGRYERERFTKWEASADANAQLAASTVLPAYTKEDEQSGVPRPALMANC